MSRCLPKSGARQSAGRIDGGQRRFRFRDEQRDLRASQDYGIAAASTKSLDDAKLGDYIRANTFTTVLGDVRFGSNGEWARSRMLQVQFQNIKSNDLAQFKDISTQVVVSPAQYESGKVIYPYENAK